MKKQTLSILVALLYVGVFTLTLEAAQSDVVSVKVTITPTISVSLSEDTLSLGAMNVGVSKASASGVTVTNNGSGIPETLSLSLTNPAGWTAAAAPSLETYVLNASFDSDGKDINWAEANHALSATPVVSSASKFAADSSGVSVPYNTTRKLWFQFKAPVATAVTNEQSILVTVTAQAS